MSTRRYFGGPRVTNGEVQQLQVDSFAELVSKYFNTPVHLKVTRAEYHAATEDEQKKLKDSAYVCPCSFKTNPARRAYENADKVMLVCFDLDDAAAARDFHECPEAVAEALYPHPFVFYKTASHTPEAPRLRIIVETEPCDIKHYKALVLYVATRLGLPAKWKGSRESNVVVQPMFRAAKFEDEEPNAVLKSRATGKPLSWKDIPEAEVLEADAGDRTYGYLSEADEDFSNLAFLPIPGLQVEDIREALFSIDPDVEYRVWYECIAAARSQFREEEEGRESFDLILEWSSGGTKFPGEAGVWAKWKSFKPDAIGRNPITIRTLFHYAMTIGGWSNTKIAGRIQRSFEEWLAETTSKDVLMEEGCKRIVAMPFKNEVVEESMQRSLQNRIKAVGGGTVSLSAVKKQVARLRSHKRREEDDGNLPSWLRPWCYVTTLDRFYNTITGEILTPEAFDRTYGKELMPVDENDDAARAGRPSVAPKDFALNIKDIPKVSGILYNPKPEAGQGGEGNEESFFTLRGKLFVNLYRSGTVPRELPGKAKHADGLIRKHLEHLVAEDEYQRLILDWMAWVVQNPGRKCRWCIVVQSKAEGAGKTILARLMMAALGEANVKIIGPQALADPKYNDWMCDAQVVALDEIWVQGAGRADIMNKLKEAVTNDTVTIHAKFRPIVTIDNWVNFIAFTNHFNAIPVSEGNRRYSFIESKVQSPGQAQTIAASGHYDRMVHLMRDSPGAVRSALLRHEVSPGFNPDGHAPMTSYMDQLFKASRNPLLSAIEDLIEDAGEPRIQGDVIDLSVVTERTSLFHRNNHRPELYLKELGFVPWENSKKFAVNGHFTPVWVHRDNFDAFLDDPVDLIQRRTLQFSEKEF